MNASVILQHIVRILMTAIAAAFGAYNAFFALLSTDVRKSYAERLWLLSFAALAALFIFILWGRKPKPVSSLLMLLALFAGWMATAYFLDALSLINK